MKRFAFALIVMLVLISVISADVLRVGDKYAKINRNLVITFVDAKAEATRGFRMVDIPSHGFVDGNYMQIIVIHPRTLGFKELQELDELCVGCNCEGDFFLRECPKLAQPELLTEGSSLEKILWKICGRHLINMNNGTEVWVEP